MGFEADIISSLKALRGGEGVTPAKLESHALLMQLLHAESGSDGVQRLNGLCDQIEDDDRRVAVKNALALDYPALSGPEERRRVRTTHPSDGAADFPFSPRTLRRREDEGMVLLAGLLMVMPSDRDNELADAKAQEEEYLNGNPSIFYLILRNFVSGEFVYNRKREYWEIRNNELAKGTITILFALVLLLGVYFFSHIPLT